ncbi:hypothetical protein [Pseudobacteriovorax antillogorgiicola]|uniref:Uncharacterized protein n=1 Tax=Pseudobacteriovorax antillogorgiicola TaxID=1513793 RepID=A0A1Y6B726_9BACT|nr:hypothetical protein [Pseudobacteriovorax antillogorgiicola]TCS59505.1 hypothetical protein EDD56_101425 [Pseudobacteriovorax antillogorgiicola]SME87895.1 hypothetical protein SAMN06296036_10160 [Pseudobacteriovorax antillogorgiicola]
MSGKAKVKKAKSAAKKKAKTTAKKKAASTAKKKAASKKKTAKKSAVKKASKKKATKNSSSKVKSEENVVAVDANPPLEEKFFNATPEVKEELSLEEKKVEEIVEPKLERDENLLQVNLSSALMKKLNKQAVEEGISLEDFVSELLAESVVLRAWEIVERKNQMRSTPSQNVNNRSGNSTSGNNRNGRKGRMSHGRYQSIMDDKATFLEYVRNQERSRR